MKWLDIAIVGYGTAGQAAAVLLSRDGHRVRVFERAPQLGPVGSGFLLQPSGMEVLWQMGLLPGLLRHGRRIERLYGDREDRHPVLDLEYRSLRPGLFGLGVQRAAMFELLHAAWSPGDRLRTGFEVKRVDADRGVVENAQGEREGPFDLVLLASGSHTALRAGLLPTRLDRAFPWGALWCLVPESTQPAEPARPDAKRDVQRSASGTCWPYPQGLMQRYRDATHMLGMLPVGSRPGDPQPQISFFWSLRGDRLQHWGDAEFVTWRQEVEAFWPQIQPWLGTLSDASQLFKARYRDVLLGPRWHRGRALLIGDAAHAMSPQLGQGVNMALRDVTLLRDLLRRSKPLEATLAEFGQLRQRQLAIYQFWSRWLTPMFQSDLRLAARWRDLSLIPSSRAPLVGTHTHRVLAGLQDGWWGAVQLAPEFIEALQPCDEPDSSVQRA